MNSILLESDNRTLDYLIADLIAAQTAWRDVRIAIDGDTLKWKIGGDAWTPPMKTDFDINKENN